MKFPYRKFTLPQYHDCFGRSILKPIIPVKISAAFLHQVILNIGGWDYKTTVGFSKDISSKGFGILGQKGFFDMFAVKFNLSSEEIEIKELKK